MLILDEWTTRLFFKQHYPRDSTPVVFLRPGSHRFMTETLDFIFPTSLGDSGDCGSWPYNEVGLGGWLRRLDMVSALSTLFTVPTLSVRFLRMENGRLGAEMGDTGTGATLLL